MKLRLLKPYVETFLASGLNQLIEKPTKLTLRIVSLIDHILTNSNEKVSNYSVISDEISDHEFSYDQTETKILVGLLAALKRMLLIIDNQLVFLETWKILL